MNLVSVTRSSPDKQGTLILMHGLGSDEQDMFGLSEVIDDRVEVICLRAPIQYGPGFAWFEIQWTEAGISVDPQQVKQSIENLWENVRAFDLSNAVIGGFSQGAMMALGTIQANPQPFAGLMMLSGRGNGYGCPRFTGEVFQAHGTYDEVISIGDAHSLRNDLQGLSDRYEYHEYPMGHSVCDAEINDLNLWLEKALKLK
jgi:phospholipase/carboxylesterase